MVESMARLYFYQLFYTLSYYVIAKWVVSCGRKLKRGSDGKRWTKKEDGIQTDLLNETATFCTLCRSFWCIFTFFLQHACFSGPTDAYHHSFIYSTM